MATADSQQRYRTLKDYLMSDWIAIILFLLRITTIASSLFYALGIFGTDATGSYEMAMFTSLLTFLIRLYQRKNESQVKLLSKQMLSLMVVEDSAHYVMYSFFFLKQRPLSIYLFPVCLYAIMHLVTFTQGLVQFLPPTIQRVLISTNTKIAESQQGIKRAIACAEVLIMVVVILNALSGMMFIFAPLVHYHFLKLRYMSKRNPYVKVVFSDLRLGAEGLARHPSCPAILSTVISKVITIVSSLAPSEMIRRDP